MVGEEGGDDSGRVVFMDSAKVQSVSSASPQVKACRAVPESPYQPFYRVDGRSDVQAATDKAQEGLCPLVKLGILGGGQLGAVLVPALLAEEGGVEDEEAGVYAAQLIVFFAALIVEALEVLGHGLAGREDQRFRMRRLLRLNVEGCLGASGNLLQLGSKGGRHCRNEFFDNK